MTLSFTLTTLPSEVLTPHPTSLTQLFTVLATFWYVLICFDTFLLSFCWIFYPFPLIFIEFLSDCTMFEVWDRKGVDFKKLTQFPFKWCASSQRRASSLVVGLFAWMKRDVIKDSVIGRLSKTSWWKKNQLMETNELMEKMSWWTKMSWWWTQNVWKVTLESKRIKWLDMV